MRARPNLDGIRSILPTFTDFSVKLQNPSYNLNAQGKYAAAQPLYEKALEIRRRLLTDDHPDTASS
jgi:hypothetical protein